MPETVSGRHNHARASALQAVLARNGLPEA